MDYKKTFLTLILLIGLTTTAAAQDNSFEDYNVQTSFSDTVQEKIITGETTYSTDDEEVNDIEYIESQSQGQTGEYIIEIETGEDEILNDAETFERTYDEADVIETEEQGNNIEEITVQEYQLDNTYYFDFDNVEAEEQEDGNIQVTADISTNELTDLILQGPGQFQEDEYDDILDAYNQQYLIDGEHAENMGDLQSLNEEIRGELDDHITATEGQIVSSDANANLEQQTEATLQFEIEPNQNEEFNIQIGSSTGNIQGIGDTITFTTCGVEEGVEGPSQGDCDTEYEFNVDIIGDGVQEWRVPETGVYTIKAKGGETSSYGPGDGAIIQADFELVEGDIIRTVVGQTGASTGAGGGTFITRISNSGDEVFDGVSVEPLIVAGGGGGDGADDDMPDDEIHGRTSTCGGTWSSSDSSPSRACDGEGGNRDTSGTGGAGAGWFEDGGGGYDGSDGDGQAFLDGALGATGDNNDAGFGGGGARDGSWGGGAGAGYSGGAAGQGDDSCCRWGGGGGSFIHASASNVKTSDGNWETTGNEPHNVYEGDVEDLNEFWDDGAGEVDVTLTDQELEEGVSIRTALFDPDTIEGQTSDLNLELELGLNTNISSAQATIYEDGQVIEEDFELSTASEEKQNRFKQKILTAEDVITAETGSGYTVHATVETEEGETLEQTIPIIQIRESGDEWQQLATTEYGESFDEARIVTSESMDDLRFSFENTYHGETIFSGEAPSQEGDEYTYEHSETITLEDNGDWSFEADDRDNPDFDGTFTHDTWGTLELDMEQPSEDIVVRQNDTFEMSGTLECVDGVCATSEDPETGDPETVEVWADPLETGSPTMLGNIRGYISQEESFDFTTELPEWYVDRADEEDLEEDQERNGFFQQTLHRFFGGGFPW